MTILRAALLVVLLVTSALAVDPPAISTATSGNLTTGSLVTVTGLRFGSGAQVYRFLNAEGAPLNTKLPSYKMYPGGADARFPAGFWSGVNGDNTVGQYRVTDSKFHAEGHALVGSVRHPGQHNASITYLPATDTSGSFPAPSIVYLTYWQYSNYLSASGNVHQQKMAGMSNSDDRDLMSKDQEGGFYWVNRISQPSGVWSANNECFAEFYPLEEGRYCGCFGNPAATCGGSQCYIWHNEMIWPGTSQADNYRFRQLQAAGNTHGNGKAPNQYVINKQWTRYELFVSASSDTMVRDGSLEIRISNSQTDPPVIYRNDKNLITHASLAKRDLSLAGETPMSTTWPTPGVFRNIFIYNFFGTPDESGLAVDYYVDDVYVGMGPHARRRVELGNASYLSQCTKWEIQPTTTWSDTEVTFTLRPASYSGDECYWLYVFNDEGFANPVGKKIVLGPVIPPPGGARGTGFEDGLGGGR